eukprot:1155523-Pelagomonas_calceolata.AAC.2
MRERPQGSSLDIPTMHANGQLCTCSKDVPTLGISSTRRTSALHGIRPLRIATVVQGLSPGSWTASTPLSSSQDHAVCGQPREAPILSNARAASLHPPAGSASALYSKNGPRPVMWNLLCSALIAAWTYGIEPRLRQGMVVYTPAPRAYIPCVTVLQTRCPFLYYYDSLETCWVRTCSAKWPVLSVEHQDIHAQLHKSNHTANVRRSQTQRSYVSLQSFIQVTSIQDAPRFIPMYRTEVNQGKEAGEAGELCAKAKCCPSTSTSNHEAQHLPEDP